MSVSEQSILADKIRRKLGLILDVRALTLLHDMRLSLDASYMLMKPKVVSGTL